MNIVDLIIGALLFGFGLLLFVTVKVAWHRLHETEQEKRDRKSWGCY